MILNHTKTQIERFQKVQFTRRIIVDGTEVLLEKQSYDLKFLRQLVCMDGVLIVTSLTASQTHTRQWNHKGQIMTSK